MNGMIAHCDTNYVPEDQVRAVEAPEWTDTWHPVPHAMVLDAMQAACKVNGLEIMDRQYSLNGTGTRMFGCWSLVPAQASHASTGMLAIRNSTDKSMVLGIAGGTKVFVCDNLALSGDYLQFRKHTGGLDLDELREIAARAVEQGVQKVAEFQAWHMGLREVPLPEAHRKVLTYNLLEQGALPPSKFNEYIECHEVERDDWGNSVFAAHGAVTRTLRGTSHFNQEKRNRALNKVVNDYLEAVNF